MATDFNSELRDSETGRLLKEHTPAQREHFILRHPAIDPATLPPVENRPDHRQVNGYVNGRRCVTADDVGLLQDPVQYVRKSSPTKPAKPEPAISLYRTATHECGHLLCAFVFDVAVARVSLIKDGDKLGHIKHANLPDSEEHLAILLGGRAAEIVAFGDERLAGSEGDMQDATAMAKRLAGDGAEKLIEKVLAKNISMLRGEKNALRYLAYELINRRQLDFEAVDAAIDRAFTRQANAAVTKVAPDKAGGRTFDLSKKEDIAAFAQKFPDVMRTADGYFMRPASDGRAKR